MAGQSKKPTFITQPFLGLWLDRPAWQIDPRAFSACNNVIILNGRVTSSLMGWTIQTPTFSGAITLLADFPIGENFHMRVVGTPTDLYNWNNGTPKFITPVYNTGTVSTNGTAVTGSGTKFKTLNATARAIAAAALAQQNSGIPTNPITLGVRNNIMPGDQISFGSASQNDPNATWFTVQSVTDDTHLVLTTSAGVQNNVAFTNRMLAQGDNNVFHWNHEVFPGAGGFFNSDMVFFTNGLDPVISWNGTDTFGIYQSDMPFTCFEMRRFKNMMIYGGLTYKGELLGTSIANSDNNDPHNLATGVAGQYTVSDGPYTINWLGVLGNNLMVYMGNMQGGSVIAASFVGFPTNFVFNEVIRGRGPIASRLVAEFPDRHQFIGMDGEYRYNGLFIQLMNTQAWRVILQNFDRSRSDKAFCAVIPQFGLVNWALPLITDPGQDIVTAYVECYLEQPQNFLFKPITQRDFPFSAITLWPTGTPYTTWDQESGQWNNDTDRWNAFSISGSYPITYVGDSSGKVYSLFSADTQNGVAYTSSATFGQRVVTTERERGLVRRIYPFVKQASGYSLTVILTLFDQLSGNSVITDTQTMAMDYSANRFTSHFRRGRLAQVQFSTAGPSQPWSLEGYDWDVSSGGQR